VATLSLRM